MILPTAVCQDHFIIWAEFLYLSGSSSGPACVSISLMFFSRSSILFPISSSKQSIKEDALQLLSKTFTTRNGYIITYI